MQGYIIYHNATATGNITSEFIPSNNSLLLYQTEIPTECPGDWFEVSVAVVNTLGEGERVTSIVVADSIQPKFDGKLFITGLKYNAWHLLLIDISATVTVKNALQTTNYYQYGTITETQGRQACMYACMHNK